MLWIIQQCKWNYLCIYVIYVFILELLIIYCALNELSNKVSSGEHFWFDE